MPSQRKRIGFLPRAEVQNKINLICEHNKLSQSKVTGILVEEALILRGVLDISKNFESGIPNKKSSLSLKIPKECFDDETEKNVALNKEGINKKEEIQMIYDYIEYKFFKNIIKNKK